MTDPDQRKTILSLIDSLSDGKGAQVDAVYIRARRHMPATAVIDTIHDLRMDGEIYEPTMNTLRTV